MLGLAFGALAVRMLLQAPETLKGHHVSLPADIYSYGVILREIITGEQPQRDNLRRPEYASACAHAPLISVISVMGTGTLDVGGYYMYTHFHLYRPSMVLAMIFPSHSINAIRLAVNGSHQPLGWR